MLTEAGVRQMADDARAGRCVPKVAVVALCETALAWKAKRDELAVALADKMAVKKEETKR
jgi:hypothetical protein